MTMRSRPRRGGETRRATFVEQAAAEEMAQLHCMIPDELHHRLRMLAALGSDHHNRAGYRGAQ